jgi:3',5'-cyclic AMP phosphodiesterase CpdA
MIGRMNAEPLAFVVHVGDITSGRGPCDDEWLEARKRQFARFKHPFVLLPGDNEWTDCHRGGFDPIERLRKWRELFCLDVVLPEFRRQKGAYCENVRWVHGNIVFVGLNIPGSNNNRRRDPLEHGERMQAVFAWLDEAVALARKRDALVILMQANPFLRPRAGPDGYEAVRARLRRIAAARPGKVLLVHGDTHEFRDDEPVPGLRRLEVFGSPHVRWIRGSLQPGGSKPFRIEPQPP